MIPADLSRVNVENLTFVSYGVAVSPVAVDPDLR